MPQNGKSHGSPQRLLVYHRICPDVHIVISTKYYYMPYVMKTNIVLLFLSLFTKLKKGI